MSKRNQRSKDKTIYGIVGLGRFGTALATELARSGAELIALDNDEENRVVAARAADRMLQIEGIRASFTLSSVGESIHVSARSDASVNVGLILEKLGGGGHYDSAGARLTGVTMKDALVMLRESIVNYCEKS
mgnify:CR=1 FL=1